MIAWAFVGAIVLGQARDGASDAVTLRDGTVILGQVVEPSPRGKLTMVVRRGWAEKAQPQRFKTWQAAEGPGLKAAVRCGVARGLLSTGPPGTRVFRSEPR